MQRNVIFTGELQRSKDSYMLRYITGNCENFCPPFPSLWEVSAMLSCYLLLESCTARELPDLHLAAATIPHWRPSTASGAQWEHLQEGREDAPLHHGCQSFHFPSDRLFPSKNMCYFLLQSFLSLFCLPFQLAAMYHSKLHPHHLPDT